MGGISCQCGDTGLDWHFLLNNAPPQGSLCLISHKKDVIFRIIKAVLQVINNAAAGAHAAAGNDDGRTFYVQKLFMLPEPFHCIEILEINGMVALSAFASLSQNSSSFEYRLVISSPSGESIKTGTFVPILSSS